MSSEIPKKQEWEMVWEGDSSSLPGVSLAKPTPSTLMLHALAMRSREVRDALEKRLLRESRCRRYVGRKRQVVGSGSNAREESRDE